VRRTRGRDRRACRPPGAAARPRSGRARRSRGLRSPRRQQWQPRQPSQSALPFGPTRSTVDVRRLGRRALVGRGEHPALPRERERRRRDRGAKMFRRGSATASPAMSSSRLSIWPLLIGRRSRQTWPPTPTSAASSRRWHGTGSAILTRCLFAAEIAAPSEPPPSLRKSGDALSRYRPGVG
jgi:hypothetical protein